MNKLAQFDESEEEVWEQKFFEIIRFNDPENKKNYCNLFQIKNKAYYRRMKEITRTAEDFRVFFTEKILLVVPTYQLEQKIRGSLCDVFTLAAAHFSARMIRENINKIKMDFENFCFFFEIVFTQFREIYFKMDKKKFDRKRFTEYLRDEHWPLLMKHHSYRISDEAFDKLKSQFL